jgi:hypothetical protein
MVAIKPPIENLAFVANDSNRQFELVEKIRYARRKLINGHLAKLGWMKARSFLMGCGGTEKSDTADTER